MPELEYNILRPNTGNKTHVIYKNHVFVAVTDYGLVLLLREVRVKYGEVNSKWIWIKMNKQAKQELEICIKDTQAFIKSLEECDELKLKSLINDKGTNHLYCFRNFKINNILLIYRL